MIRFLAKPDCLYAILLGREGMIHVSYQRILTFAKQTKGNHFPVLDHRHAPLRL
jgi:hypothetical protein